MSSTNVRIETRDGVQLDVVHHTVTGPSHGTVLLAHGITRDMDEGGMFVRIADRLVEAGFNAVRFSFRGHGNSGGTEAGVTVAGEMLDLERVFEYTKLRFKGPCFILAKSFGAVPTCLSLDHYYDDVRGIILWNPVLDVRGTFLEPKVPWGRRNFVGEKLAELGRRGFLRIDGSFEFGWVLWEELHRYDPGARLRDSTLPALIVHGDADDIVPYDDVRRIAEEADVDFHTIEDGDHGFVRPQDSRASSDDLREHDRVTVEWLEEKVGS